MRILLFLLTLLLVNSSFGFATPAETDISLQLMDKLSFENINSFIAKVNQELNEDIPLLNAATVSQIAQRGLGFEWSKLWQGLVASLFKELAANAHLMGKLLFLAVLCSLLHNLQCSFEHTTIAALAYGLCFVFSAVIALNAFYNVVNVARDGIDKMVGLMQALLPLMITLLAGVGAVTSAALFSPLMALVINTVSLIVKDIVVPLLILTAVLDCTNYLSEKYRLSNLVSLFKQTGMVILGFTLVVFIGIITIQGVAGSVADGITLRTAKYATATFIPVVGKMFADTVEVVMGASLLLKNSIGIFGVLVIGMICTFPVIKLVSLIIIIKVAGALVQPLGDERMAKCLDDIGNNLFLVFTCLLTTALMCFLAITMIIGSGSVAMMFR